MTAQSAPCAKATEVHFCRAADIPADWQSAWDDLAAHATEPNVFLQRWFLQPSLAHISLPESLRMAFVWQGSRLIGVKTFFIARRYGRLVLPHVQTWSHYHSFLGTPLVRAGAEDAFWHALLLALDEQDWADGLLHLTGLVDDDSLHHALIRTARAIGRPCDVVHRTERAMLQSELSADAYYEANVRKKKRKEIGRLQSRLSELGEIACETARSAEDAAAYAEAFLALEANGWKGSAGSALACTPETASFFREIVKGAWASNQLDFRRLSLDGKPIAMLVNFVAMPGSFSYKIAFDESYARFSPGVLIQLDNLQNLERPGFGWMDSCAVENHPMINSLWAERRAIIRVSIPLGGLKRGMVFRFCRTAEDSWAQLKKLKGTKRFPVTPKEQSLEQPGL